MKRVVSIVSVLAVALIVYFARGELIQAFYLLGKLNLWWLIWLLPMQLLVYYSMSEAGISYLEQIKQIKNVSWWTKIRIALELNFVNHILPSGGVSGVGYGLWRLKTVGVGKTYATLTQIIRLLAGYIAYVPILIIGVLLSVISGNAHYILETVATCIVILFLSIVIWFGYILTKKSRLVRMAGSFVQLVNLLVRIISWGKIKQAVSEKKFKKTLMEFSDIYNQLFAEKKLLIKPFIWGLVWIAGDTLMFEITFLSLGQGINLTAIFLAYGFAGISGFIFMTPGGAGAYEAAFIFILVWSGIAAPLATSGVILTRTILMFCTLLSGAFFYYKALHTV
ncbi:MAG: flippase-like domain-containing protein [Bifidobacteriaceae bacterium]|jgi:uncharacterized protein (TIRG00374 family)|nr:flippase-like domain-containing protein [Bifidobacteriaceae bacterium]